MRPTLLAAALLWHAAAGAAHAQAPVLVEVRLEQEGRALADPVVGGLVETPIGAPVSMRQVRETITHLMSLERFADVRVYRETAAAGIRLRYDLVPLHPVDRVEFQGVLGLDADELRQVVTDRFGEAPPAARAGEVTEVLRVHYRDRGYVRATLSSRIDVTHAPDRASMVIEAIAGPQARIATVEVDAAGAPPRLEGTPVAAGRAYDAAAIEETLLAHENELRAAGYYEARASHTVVFDAAGVAAEVEVFVDRGPLVMVAFAGDPLPDADLEALVPVRAEASADQDLLEDAALAIEAYLHEDGYRDASASFTVAETDELLAITFDVRRGPRYVVTGASAAGNQAVASETLLAMVPFEPGDPYVEATLRGGVEAALDLYGSQGFASASIEALLSVADAPDPAARLVAVTLRVTEGPRALVRAIRLAGNTVLSDGAVLALMATATGAPFSAPTVAADRDRIELAYLDAGYESVVVRPRAALVDDGTGAEVEIAIDEGPQTLVDEVIVVGNQRTALETIRAELLLAPGDPLGFSARLESQRRLSALGLFRRVTITPLGRLSDPQRDLLVVVEEAPPTTLGYGAGLEGGTRLRPTGPARQAEERFEVAPRGFFEIGRSNLWGKNRSINLFTRVSLRSRDAAIGADEGTGAGFGFNEYRVFATFREPRAFGTGAEVLVTGILDQAIRSSFNFVTREARAEIGVAASPAITLAGRYSYRHTRLFDERFTDEEKPLIDRLFPQVRISKVAGSILRDTRDDVLDPDAGTFLSLDADVAARAAGSEVGFAKAFVQAFTYHRLPTARRMVVALAARVGVADGFPRTVALVGSDGQPVLAASGRPIVEIVEDLPASERFFAGGDTTVRGFSLDRLGNAETISPSGFPTGGNGEIVLNAELRMALFGPFGVTTFLDAGNIFPRAGDLDLTDLRSAAGVGLRYDSPVGPLRLDLGFNLDPSELVPGTRERRAVFHISLGQAF
jgi:outer membrane protein assembly complex protein YaeT